MLIEESRKYFQFLTFAAENKPLCLDVDMHVKLEVQQEHTFLSVFPR